MLLFGEWFTYAYLGFNVLFKHSLFYITKDGKYKSIRERDSKGLHIASL